MVLSATISEKLQFSHSTLSSLPRLETRLLLLQPLLRSIIQSIQLLEAYNGSLSVSGDISNECQSATKDFLKNYEITAEAYLQNATFLLYKVRGTAQLLPDTLNLRHQQSAQTVSENTFIFTRSTVQDSATIRVITLVTMLYLPASFVAVS